MKQTTVTAKRGLTRATVVERALQIGNAEGLEAVSVRRLAADLGVTPMALYRHVRDKQDLINAMTEAILEGLDLSVGLRPSMAWTDQLSKVLSNFKEQMDARPLALPLSIAYTGEGPADFWRMTELLLGILLGAGFKRRDAAVMIRVISNILTGYLLLLRSDDATAHDFRPEEVNLLRKRMELAQLSLPREEFPNIVTSARDIANVWISNPDRWWRDTSDLLVYGIEAMHSRKTARIPAKEID